MKKVKTIRYRHKERKRREQKTRNEERKYNETVRIESEDKKLIYKNYFNG